MSDDHMRLSGKPPAVPEPADWATHHAALRTVRLCPPSHAAPEWQFQVLDEIDYGIVVLDWDGQVIFVNHAARARLRAGKTLRIDRGTLVAATARDFRLLNEAVQAAAVQALRRMVLLGAGPDQIEVAVVPGPRSQGANRHRVLVMLPRRMLCEPLSTYGFARDHGLSPTETQVLQLLCEGLPPQDIAERQGVGIATVRTQIAGIRSKTDTTNVGALIRRIARLPPIRRALEPDGAAPASMRP